MPSFDIVSQVNSMEIENGVNIAKKELANRFDFKGSKAEIALDKNEIKLSADDAFKIKALAEIVLGKLARRNISLKSIEQKEPDVSPLGHARQVILIKQGIETPVAKEIAAFIRGLGLKVWHCSSKTSATDRQRGDIWSAPAKRSEDGALATQANSWRHEPNRCRATLATALQNHRRQLSTQRSSGRTR